MKKIELLQAATPTDVEILSDNIIENIIGGAVALQQNEAERKCNKGFSVSEKSDKIKCRCGYSD